MKKQSGFTLIELMIVVGIIGILSGIAYPMYQRQMLESRRSDAHVALARMAQLQEDFYANGRNRYATNAELAVTTENGWYNLTVTAANSTSFTLTATPVAGGRQAADTACLTITLNSAGVKGPNADCW